MFRRIAPLLLAVFLNAAWMPHGAPSGSSPPSTNWQILPIGAGGNVTGLNIANDDTMVDRIDVFGAYLWQPGVTSPVGTTGTWSQLVNSSSMPADQVANASGLFTGSLEMRVAPKNSQIMFMIATHYPNISNAPAQTVYKSINQGATFTATGFTPIAFNVDANGGNKLVAPKMDIDPSDATAQEVFVGTGSNGLFCTLNGGTSWTNISSISVPTSTGNYGYSVAISGFNNQQIVAYSNTSGVYVGSSGCSNSGWTKPSGGPTQVLNAQFDNTTGIYYCIDGSGNAWRLIIGTGWTEIYTAGTAAKDIAVDPDLVSGQASNHVIIGDGNGNMNESTNAGTTASFGGWSTSNNPSSATGDVTWLQLFATNDQILYFDRTTAKKLIATTNRGVATATYSGSITSATEIIWNFQSRGMETLVGNAIDVPITNAPVVAVWDSGVFTLNPSVYPSTFYPGTTSVQAGWSLDHCSSNSSYEVANIDGNYAGFPQASAQYNGSSWTAFTPPSNAYPNGGQAGSIACLAPAKVLFAPGDGQQPSVTITCCTSPTWVPITIAGANWSNFQPNADTGGIGNRVCADRNGANTYYLAFDGVGFYSIDGTTGVGTFISSTALSGNLQIKCTPGQSGDWWASTGGTGFGNNVPCGANPVHYYSGTVTTITNILCTFSIGTGYNNGGYPSVYVAGWYHDTSTTALTVSAPGSQTLTVSAGSQVYAAGQTITLSAFGVFYATGLVTSYTSPTLVVNVTSVEQSGSCSPCSIDVEPLGIFQSDNAATGATPTWKVIATWPYNHLDYLKDISGDPGIYGRAYACFSGSGCEYN